ncbi:hypothetical protein [Enterobacter cloacae]|uniref:hypothetical protein n=1 Tax=Enterobacter cloacae TaxID=550 RepID=UPI00388D48A3
MAKNKYTLLQQSHFTKLAEEPEKPIKQMAMELDTRLYEVGEYLEQEDNPAPEYHLRNPQGKRFWRLAFGQQTSSGQQSLLPANSHNGDCGCTAHG